MWRAVASIMNWIAGAMSRGRRPAPSLTEAAPAVECSTAASEPAPVSIEEPAPCTVALAGAPAGGDGKPKPTASRHHPPVL